VCGEEGKGEVEGFIYARPGETAMITFGYALCDAKVMLLLMMLLVIFIAIILAAFYRMYTFLPRYSWSRHSGLLFWFFRQERDRTWRLNIVFFNAQTCRSLGLSFRQGQCLQCVEKRREGKGREGRGLYTHIPGGTAMVAFLLV